MVFKDKSYKEIRRLFAMNYQMMSMLSDAVYNKDRYAYNVTFIIIEVNPPCNKLCEKVQKFIRRNDKLYKISEQYCLLEYSFVSFEEAKIAFGNLKDSILSSLDSYRYTLVSLEDYLDIDTVQLMDILASTLAESNIVYPKK